MNPWDERYSDQEFYYGREPNDFLKLHAAKIKSGGKVLCLAEGEGRNAVYLATLGLQVTAVDQSAKGLEKMKGFAAQRSVSVQAVVADLAQYSIQPNAWDAVVSIWCHVPPTLRKMLHGDIVSGLKPNGILILESYHPRQLGFQTGGPPSAELMMTKDELENELKGLQFEVLQEIEREVHEGKGHHGISAVTQLLARK